MSKGLPSALATITATDLVSPGLNMVFFNIYNNAFYAAYQKKLILNRNPQFSEFEPQVSVTTKKLTDKIEIRITVNGNGIPENIAGKVFQPLPDLVSRAGFFTTKPTGKGTGLGLSLAYDIITIGHNGELSVVSKVNEGSIFTILLPTD